tara:strand:+ start:53 stop:457 length:405 start_codon:yes stop_codon:yes gene_type:complete
MGIYNYRVFLVAFILQALIIASISTLSIETRVGIYSNKQKPYSSDKTYSIYNLLSQLFYILRILPYKISEKLGILNSQGEVEEWVKMLYTFIISFTISIIVYHIFLIIFGYEEIYKYYMGNFPMSTKKLIKSAK